MFEPRPWDFSMKTQVGGKQGFNETATVSKIAWPKNEFYEGEVCEVKIECDNSECAHSVLNYTVSLIQKKIIQIEDGQGPISNEHVIHSQTDAEGCPVGEKREFSIPFEIRNHRRENILQNWDE